MTWFKYFTENTEKNASVRRQIVFPLLSERLKIGDWLQVNLDTLDIGRFYYREDGLIKSSFDSDSYIVVYEEADQKTPTFSLIVDSDSTKLFKRNLWFKSLTNVEPGNKPSGTYYIYYHKDLIQYVSLQGNNYVSTSSPTGSNFIASVSGNSASSINYFSTEVSLVSNTRVAAFGFLGDKEIWTDGRTNQSGSKVVGTFSGPRLKIYAEKNGSSGKVSLSIIKASATGQGQEVVKKDLEIDLYSPLVETNQLVYELDMQQDETYSTYEELYGDFYFEITTLDSKNESSSSLGAKVEKYSFSKNYELQLSDEEIKSDLAFQTTGGVK